MSEAIEQAARRAVEQLRALRSELLAGHRYSLGDITGRIRRITVALERELAPEKEREETGE